mgnify:CR=1 FL=1
MIVLYSIYIKIRNNVYIIFIYVGKDTDNKKRKLKIPFLLNDKNNKREKTMKEVIALVKGWVDDIAQLLASFIAIGAVSEVLFGSGIFGVTVIGNLTSIINNFGESGFAGLVALLVLVGLFRK